MTAQQHPPKAKAKGKATRALAQPRICTQCSQPFELPSLKSGEVCYRCAVRFDRQQEVPS